MSAGTFQGNDIYLKYTFVGAKAISFKVEAFASGLFFGASGRDRADRLRADLKTRLASSHSDLEYVEQLRSR